LIQPPASIAGNHTTKENMQTHRERYYTDVEGSYYKRCNKAHKATGQRCVICLKKSTNVHHASYGNDIVGKTIFPVCHSCHETVCHHQTNWIIHKDKMKSRNTPAFTEYLQMQFAFIEIVHTPTKGKLTYSTKRPGSTNKVKYATKK
jgi:hypothetical protein